MSSQSHRSKYVMKHQQKNTMIYQIYGPNIKAKGNHSKTTMMQNQNRMLGVSTTTNMDLTLPEINNK